MTSDGKLVKAITDKQSDIKSSLAYNGCILSLGIAAGLATTGAVTIVAWTFASMASFLIIEKIAEYSGYARIKREAPQKEQSGLLHARSEEYSASGNRWRNIGLAALGVTILTASSFMPAAALALSFVKYPAIALGIASYFVSIAYDGLAQSARSTSKFLRQKTFDTPHPRLESEQAFKMSISWKPQRGLKKLFSRKAADEQKNGNDTPPAAPDTPQEKSVVIIKIS